MSVKSRFKSVKREVVARILAGEKSLVFSGGRAVGMEMLALSIIQRHFIPSNGIVKYEGLA